MGPPTGDLSPVSPVGLVHEAEHAPHDLLREITELFGASHYVRCSRRLRVCLLVA